MPQRQADEPPGAPGSRPKGRGQLVGSRRPAAHRLGVVARWALLVLPATPGLAFAQAATFPPPRVGGYMQVRETLVPGAGFSATLNRVRLSADGALPNRFTYRMLVEFQAGATARTPGGVSLREAIIRWSVAPWGVQFGQFKTPFSREYLLPVPALETADFSAVVDTLAPKYDIGAMADYSGAVLGAWLGVFNGEGQNAGLNRDSTVIEVGRLTVHPIPQTTLGIHAARYSPESTRYGSDLTLEQSGFLARGELLGQRTRGRSRDDFGWYVLGAYRAVPWLQLLIKQEDFQRPSLGLARRISATTGGANVELPGGRTRLLLEFVSRNTGFPRVRKHAAISQLQVRF